MTNKLELKRPRALQWIKIRRLYRSAFPRYERKPFSIIRNMYRKGKTDVWYCECGGVFSGFAATINSYELIMLDYFSVPHTLRGKGVGSAVLKALMELYSDKGFFVEIESMFESAPNTKERIDRRNFYIRNGLLPLGVMADVFGIKMELLGARCSLDFKTYRDFYNDNYSPWAAEHIHEAVHPEAVKKENEDA